MSFSLMLFNQFAFGAISAGLLVIASKNPVHSVLSLILAFVNVSGILLLMSAEFLALLFLVVYVGAIAVLFLFVVMMLNVSVAEEDSNAQTLPMAGLMGLLFLAQGYGLLSGDWVNVSGAALQNKVMYRDWEWVFDTSSTLEALGMILYTDHAGHFLLAGLILLVAMLGAILLTLTVHSAEVQGKAQAISQQMSRNSDSLFLTTPK